MPRHCAHDAVCFLRDAIRRCLSGPPDLCRPPDWFLMRNDAQQPAASRCCTLVGLTGQPMSRAAADALRADEERRVKIIVATIVTTQDEKEARLREEVRGPIGLSEEQLHRDPGEAQRRTLEERREHRQMEEDTHSIVEASAMASATGDGASLLAIGGDATIDVDVKDYINRTDIEWKAQAEYESSPLTDQQMAMAAPSVATRWQTDQAGGDRAGSDHVGADHATPAAVDATPKAREHSDTAGADAVHPPSS